MREKLQVNLDIDKNGAHFLVKNKKLLKFKSLKFKILDNYNQRRPTSFKVFIQQKNIIKELLAFNIVKEIDLISNFDITSNFYIIVKPKQQYKLFNSFQISMWFDVL